jgi:hypothetical protein
MPSNFGSIVIVVVIVIRVMCICQVMVFFSSCNAVKFHSELLNYVDVPVSEIHGRQKQQKRTTTFFEFCNAKSGILLCTGTYSLCLYSPVHLSIHPWRLVYMREWRLFPDQLCMYVCMYDQIR